MEATSHFSWGPSPQTPTVRSVAGGVGCPGAASHFSWGEAPHVAGAASAVLGVVQAVALAISAPLASSGGARTAAPMIWVMLAGVAGSLISYLVVARPSTDPAVEHASTR
jgi:hypothetical protein